jgi:hypothetical protein
MQEVNGVVVYDTLQEIVDPKHSCLVVWDVQNGLVDRSFNKEEFLANLKGFVEKLRGKMPVVYTLITPVARGFDSGWRYYSAMRRFNVTDVSKIPPFMAIGSKERLRFTPTTPPHGTNSGGFRRNREQRNRPQSRTRKRFKLPGTVSPPVRSMRLHGGTFGEMDMGSILFIRSVMD